MFGSKTCTVTARCGKFLIEPPRRLNARGHVACHLLDPAGSRNYRLEWMEWSYSSVVLAMAIRRYSALEAVCAIEPTSDQPSNSLVTPRESPANAATKVQKNVR
jgi:hypothetical protein